MARPVTTKSLVSLLSTAVLLSVFSMTACGDDGDGDDESDDSGTGGTSSGGASSGGTSSGGTTTGGTSTAGTAGQQLMNLRKNNAPSAR